MNCPVCSNALSKKVVSGVELEICNNGCGGIWFDQFEFKKFDEPIEPDAETELNIKINTQAKPDKTKRYNCPKCKSSIMMRNFVSVKRKVTIDECPTCAGVWLDAGELQEIRGEFGSEAERKAAASALFEQMFGEALADEDKKSDEQHAKARKFANSFRFICPSYYIPGKQNGGAF